jgi:SAM-dependent methyltransferase
MGAVIYEDRRRAESFGEAALEYDRARPTYPAELVDDLMTGEPRRVLDVGCGTGKAARLFAARGCGVLGVEPDPRMAEVARGHGLVVEVTTFEDWDADGRTFDLVISGQAWHWVDPSVGAAKAGSVLRAGASLGVFWNYIHLEDETKAALDAVYRAHAPTMLENYVLGTRARDAQAFRDALASSRLFDQPWIRQYDWDRRLSRAEWLDLLPTQSDHRVLPPQQRAQLLEGVGDAIDKLGGSVLVHWETELIITRRLAE